MKVNRNFDNLVPNYLLLKSQRELMNIVVLILTKGY